MKSGLVNTIVMVVMLLLAIPTTAILASNNAVPGDAMYPVKTTLETIASKLTSPAYKAHSELEIQLIQRRIAENQKLLVANGSTEGLKLLIAQAEAATEYILNSNVKTEVKNQTITKLINTLEETNQILEQEKKSYAYTHGGSNSSTSNPTISQGNSPQSESNTQTNTYTNSDTNSVQTTTQEQTTTQDQTSTKKKSSNTTQQQNTSDNDSNNFTDDENGENDSESSSYEQDFDNAQKKINEYADKAQQKLTTNSNSSPSSNNDSSPHTNAPTDGVGHVASPADIRQQVAEDMERDRLERLAEELAKQEKETEDELDIYTNKGLDLYEEDTPSNSTSPQYADESTLNPAAM